MFTEFFFNVVVLRRMKMKHFYFITMMLSCTISLFATEATDVSMMELNGPVKSYSKGRETFFFDESGYLTKAKRSTKVDVIIGWWEYYVHYFDKNGRRIKTKVYRDSTRKKLIETIKYKYNKDGLIIEARTGDSFSSYNSTPYWKTVLLEYGSKKHEPNSVLKEKRRTRVKRRVHKDSVYCFYNDDGNLYLFRKIDNFTNREISFSGDTLDRIYFKSAREHYVEYNSQGKIQADVDNWNSDEEDSEIMKEYYKYNALGLLVEKRQFRKNYCKNCVFTIHNIDCVVNIQFRSFN